MNLPAYQPDTIQHGRVYQCRSMCQSLTAQDSFFFFRLILFEVSKKRSSFQQVKCVLKAFCSANGLKEKQKFGSTIRFFDLDQHARATANKLLSFIELISSGESGFQVQNPDQRLELFTV